jgi:hypothetical protein
MRSDQESVAQGGSTEAGAKSCGQARVAEYGMCTRAGLVHVLHNKLHWPEHELQNEERGSSRVCHAVATSTRTHTRGVFRRAFESR